MTRILILAQATLIAATLYAGFAHAEGKVIARKDLPAAVRGAVVAAGDENEDGY
jgi:hypothetical protein